MPLPAQSPAKPQNKINRVETRESENQGIRKSENRDIRVNLIS